MTWAIELKKIRRLLRDPEGNIWSDSFLRHLYNDVQREIQEKTMVLEDAVTQRVPAIYHMAYQHDWEYRFLPQDKSQFYQCLQQYDDAVFCHRWETQI